MKELEAIRQEIEQNIGKKVWVKAKRGRSKSLVNEGILGDSYPSVFTIVVEKEGEPGILSYTYGDILTNHLELRVLDE